MTVDNKGHTQNILNSEILNNIYYFFSNDDVLEHTGPGCSKLTTSLVNDSLKFTSSDTQICRSFLLKKCE